MEGPSHICRQSEGSLDNKYFKDLLYDFFGVRSIHNIRPFEVPLETNHAVKSLRDFLSMQLLLNLCKKILRRFRRTSIKRRTFSHSIGRRAFKCLPQIEELLKFFYRRSIDKGVFKGLPQIGKLLKFYYGVALKGFPQTGGSLRAFIDLLSKEHTLKALQNKFFFFQTEYTPLQIQAPVELFCEHLELFNILKTVLISHNHLKLFYREKTLYNSSIDRRFVEPLLQKEDTNPFVAEKFAFDSFI